MSVSLFLWKDSQLKFLPELSVEGGYRLSESTVMAQYIADKHSKSHLKYCDVGFGINGGGEGVVVEPHPRTTSEAECMHSLKPCYPNAGQPCVHLPSYTVQMCIQQHAHCVCWPRGDSV